MTHICFSRQCHHWLIELLGINPSEISIKFQGLSGEKINLKMLSAMQWLFCRGLWLIDCDIGRRDFNYAITCYFLNFAPIIVNIPYFIETTPDSKVHGANMGAIWGRQDPGGPRVSPMNFVIWDVPNDTDCIPLSHLPRAHRLRVNISCWSRMKPTITSHGV